MGLESELSEGSGIDITVHLHSVIKEVLVQKPDGTWTFDLDKDSDALNSLLGRAIEDPAYSVMVICIALANLAQFILELCEDTGTNPHDYLLSATTLGFAHNPR